MRKTISRKLDTAVLWLLAALSFIVLGTIGTVIAVACAAVITPYACAKGILAGVRKIQADYRKAWQEMDALTADVARQPAPEYWSRCYQPRAMAADEMDSPGPKEHL